VRSERGGAHLALSGGTTPRRTYELLAKEPMDWTGVEVWFADERCVGPADAQSNYRLAFETLLGPAGIPSAQVHRMEGELGPEEGARRYGLALEEHVRARDGELPVLDLVLLGIGGDGHVASLFPGAPALDAGERAPCVGVRDSPKPPPERITLTYPVLNAARAVLFLVTGAEKRAAAARLREGDPVIPAGRVRAAQILLFLDEAAAR
jgi:6-phosphogluconolactonase